MSWHRALDRLPLAAAVVIVGCWLVQAAGPGLPRALERGIVLVAAAALSVWMARFTAAAWRAPSREERVARRVLLVLIALALAVKLVGIGFELSDHPRNDEGGYHQIARAVNEGGLLPKRLVYGHFLYYTGAMVLWLGDLFPGLAASIATLGGAESAYDVDHFWLRSWTALLAALTVVPVFASARLLFGLAAGVAAALLIAFSPLYNQVAHYFTGDVPTGFFTALAFYYLVRLSERESLRDYLLAGVAAAFAAASKYPAGVVAVGIIGVWLAWRIRRRDFSWALLWSGLASLATFLALMPALLAHPERVFSGEGHGLTFGFRLYFKGGWLGVEPDVPILWYGQRLLDTFGWPAVLLALCGLALWARRVPFRLVALLPYPVVHLALLAAMQIAVKRNLQPLLPVLCILAGAGIGMLATTLLSAAWLDRWPRRLRAAAVWGLVAAAAASPAMRSISWDLARTGQGTRGLAAEWIEANVPVGAGIVHEYGTPRLDPKRYNLATERYVTKLEIEEILDPRWDFLVTASSASWRFYRPELRDLLVSREMRRRYERLFELDQVYEALPSRLRAGPHIRVLRIDPPRIVYRARRRFASGDAAWLSARMRVEESKGGVLRFGGGLSRVVFKDYFRAGSYRLRLFMRVAGEGGAVRVTTRDNTEIGTWPASAEINLALPRRDKYFIDVHLPARSLLSELRVIRSGPDKRSVE